MWRQLSIRNFRSIEQADVTFSRFTVLVGRNSVGKSNVADALVFFSEMTSRPDLAFAHRGGPAGVFHRHQRQGAGAHVRLVLAVAGTRAALSGSRGPRIRCSFRLALRGNPPWVIKEQAVSLHRKGVELDVELHDGRLTRGQLDFPLPALEPTASMIPYLRGIRHYAGALRPLGAVRRYRLSPEAMSSPREASEAVVLEEDGGNIATAVEHLRGAPVSSSRYRRWTSVLSGVQRIFPGLRDIEVEPIGRFRRLVFHQVAESGREARFSAAEVSDGTLHALGLLVAAAQISRGELLIVEEPESHLNPGAAQILFDQLKDASRRGAVLVTTHSPELLEAVANETILVCRYENGRTLVGPLARSQQALVREGLFTVAELVRSEDLRIEGCEVETLSPAHPGALEGCHA